MGQYFRAVVEDQKGTRVYCAWANLVDEDGVHFVDQCGLKLTEHSSFGNPFSDGISAMLYNRVAHVAWVGDYTTDPSVKNGRYFAKKAYGLNMKKARRADNVDGCIFNFKNKYLVNLSKNEFVDYSKYLDTVKSNNPNWSAFNPLPILTAVGNGLGSGDYAGKGTQWYRDDSTDNLIGTWAGDLLTIVDDLSSCGDPVSFKELFPRFVEYAKDEYLEEFIENAEWLEKQPKYIEWCEKNDCVNKPLKERRLNLEGNSWYK